MTFISLILIFIGRKINLSDRIVIKESLNQDSFSGIVNLILRIAKFTLLFETIGAILLSIEFIPEYGIAKGIFFSIFHSISAFCNAGFDIIGTNSLLNYNSNIIINFTIIILIVIGGLGFAVWNDILQSFKEVIKEKFSFKRIWKEFSLHTKLVLTVTFILLLSGTIIIFCLESSHSFLGNNLGTKVLKSAFQSTTIRTAGFSTIDQSSLTSASKLFSICYMFIGASPGSTGGGIKTTTLAVLMLCVVSFILGKNETIAYKKSISMDIIKRSIVILVISIFIVIVVTFLLLSTEKISELRTVGSFTFMDIVFETVSAFGTVGLSLNVTSFLSVIGKLLISALMIIGRLGPITISIALFKNSKEKNDNVAIHPKGNVLVG